MYAVCWFNKPGGILQEHEKSLIYKRPNLYYERIILGLGKQR